MPTSSEPASRNRSSPRFVWRQPGLTAPISPWRRGVVAGRHRQSACVTGTDTVHPLASPDPPFSCSEKGTWGGVGVGPKEAITSLPSSLPRESVRRIGAAGVGGFYHEVDRDVPHDRDGHLVA